MRINTKILVRLTSSLVLIQLTGLFNPGFAQALEGNVEQTILSSELIVIGKVNRTHCEWNEDKTRILTRVAVGVDEYLKGESPEPEVSLMYWGGEIDGVGELYTHTPTFQANEHVLIFLKKDKNENYRVNGGCAGKMVVSEDKKNGQLMIDTNESVQSIKSRIDTILDAQRK